MKMFRKPVVLVLILVVEIGLSDYMSHVIDMDDILSESLMPGSLLMLENPEIGVKSVNETSQASTVDSVVADGTFGKAMETMNFHRLKMNQYLCRGFLAEEIIANMSVSRVKRRMGHVTPGIGDPSIQSKFQLNTKKDLINDEGSMGYKDWLAKSTTLEDIYRHYDQAENRIDNEEDENKEEDFEEEYNTPTTDSKDKSQTALRHRGQGAEEIYYSAAGGDGGGGYGYHQSSGGQDYHNGGHNGGGYGGGSIGGGYGGGHSGGGGGYEGGNSGFGEGYPIHEPNDGHVSYDDIHNRHPEQVIYSSPPKHQTYHEYNYYTKEKDLADLFEIALTALAFLAFKMFIIHVIMCIASVADSTTTTASTMAMSMNPTATATGGGTTSTGGGTTSTGGGTTGTGDGNTSTGGGTTSTGGGTSSTGGGNTGTGGGTTSTGGGTTGTGGGNTGTGGGTTSTGDGTTSTGGGVTSTGGGATGTGGGTTGTGGGTDTGGGGTGDGTGGDTGGGGTGTGGTSTGGTATGTGSGGPTGGTATGGTAGGRDSFKYRIKRDIPTISNPDTQALNELARKVLISIESALVANDDDGECLRKSLCENNKWSRTLDGRTRLFVPFWSLGMSWLSGRLVKGISASTSMLDTLKASLLGLGNANCEIIYQKCNLAREVMERRRRRKRRKRAAK